jgi:hypothetical protein
MNATLIVPPYISCASTCFIKKFPHFLVHFLIFNSTSIDDLVNDKHTMEHK